jgi:hypothetical protein
MTCRQKQKHYWGAKPVHPSEEAYNPLYIGLIKAVVAEQEKKMPIRKHD